MIRLFSLIMVLIFSLGANTSGLLFGAFGNSVQKIQDLVRCDAIDGFSTEFLAEFSKNRLVGRDRIFFVNWTCDNPARVLPLV